MRKLTRESGIVVSDDYKKMLSILDHIYFTRYDDCLGGLLGCWSLDVMADGAPADLGDYEIWIKCEQEKSDKDILEKTIYFLESFIAEFEYYELQPTVDIVKSLTMHDVNRILNSSTFPTE
ncbi:MAG: hypothetical protein ACI4TK_11655 [Agathobacter sp.]